MLGIKDIIGQHGPTHKEMLVIKDIIGQGGAFRKVIPRIKDIIGHGQCHNTMLGIGDVSCLAFVHNTQCMSHAFIVLERLLKPLFTPWSLLLP